MRVGEPILPLVANGRDCVMRCDIYYKNEGKK